MECHIEQVLYRDQRTIKTRTYFEECTRHRHQPNTCPTCRISQKSSKKCGQKRNNPSSAVSFPDGVANDGISIRGVPNSSLYFNCHNQYCSKFKRLLYQTDVQCGCEDVNYFTEVSEKKAASCKSWFKKFHNFLLIGTYLSLVTFPYVCAVPTTISSRSTLGAKGTKHTMNITNLHYAYRSARTAANLAEDLRIKLRESADNDPEVVYKNVAYDWLPAVPAIPGTKEYEEHLQRLELEQVVQQTLKNVKVFRSTMDDLYVDLKDDENVIKNISNMRGALDNIIDDLNWTLTANNMEPDKVEMKGMPENLKKLSKTNQTDRDWLIIRALVDILKYTLAVFEHFNITGDP